MNPNISIKFYYQKNATAPRLYGLPKIHKPDTPLRPVSSSMHVPCYDLSKHIGEILKNRISTNYNIKNSFELIDILPNITLDKEDILVSFDVISLFTDIPIHLAIKNVTECETIKQHTKIKRSKFLTVLDFSLKGNNFSKFNENFYQQTIGMPMGNGHSIGQTLRLHNIYFKKQKCR